MCGGGKSALKRRHAGRLDVVAHLFSRQRGRETKQARKGAAVASEPSPLSSWCQHSSALPGMTSGTARPRLCSPVKPAGGQQS